MQLANSGTPQPEMNTMPDLSKLEFSTRALVEGLVAHGILVPSMVLGLLESLRKHAVVPYFRDRILESLWNEERIRNPDGVVKGESRCGSGSDLLPAKAAFLRRSEAIVLPHLVMIRTVIVTPTRVLSGPLQQEPSNSVTRRYQDRIDGIIRVCFTDEEDRLHVGLIDNYCFADDHQLNHTTKQSDNSRPDVGPMARVRRALQYGVIIGGRRFMPVASSSSQQK